MDRIVADLDCFGLDRKLFAIDLTLRHLLCVGSKGPRLSRHHVAMVILILAALASADAAIFTTFDPPGSTGTFAQSINTAGAITGSYKDAAGVFRGFA